MHTLDVSHVEGERIMLVTITQPDTMVSYVLTNIMLMGNASDVTRLSTGTLLSIEKVLLDATDQILSIISTATATIPGNGQEKI